MSPSRAARAVGIVGLISMFLVGGVLTAPTSVFADPLAPIDLGTAGTYAVLSGASVAGTAVSTVRGDLGVKIAGTVTGFPPGVITGTKHDGDSQAVQAHVDLVAAYLDAQTRPFTATFAGNQIGAILTPGVYNSVGAVSNTGTMTLDGLNDPNAVFILQVGGALHMAAASQVTLINGTQASRVFWQVNGAATLAAGARFAGTIMALDAFGAADGAIVNGRGLALNGAVTLDNNEFYTKPPVVTITGSPVASATTATPTIDGTTDIAVGQTVTVTVAGQSLTAVVQSGGTWAVTPTVVADGTYTVVATVNDSAGNPGSATQLLTIDTVPPVLTIAGGATASTNNTTPTIVGNSTDTVGQTVTVTVAGQSLTAVVQANGTWTATSATSLTDGTYTVVATVDDSSGNPGSATQLLTIDTVPPVLTITGGATASTNDATPTIEGGSDVATGTIVTITGAGSLLTAVVQGNGTWTVTPTALTDDTYTVVATVTDPVGNTTTATQSLTLDTIAPTVTITGGATRLTNNATPTISGTTTSDVALGSTVTVTIAGQTLTTTIQAGRTWTVTAAVVANGTHPVLVSVIDFSGNPGSATQSLTIDTVPPVLTITGGATASTNDATPTIAGNSTDTVGQTVTVTVAGQSLTTPVQSGGNWTVTPTSLTDGTYTVVATVADPVGNTTTATQTLTLDTVAPTVTITGGATKLTSDPTPTISGTTTSDVAIGAAVTVTIAGQTLTTTIQAGRTWTVTAAAVTDGTHPVLVSVLDSADNPGSATQLLTIDTVPPVLTIAGGASASTNDATPTIAGTSNVATGTTVTITGAGSVLTALVQDDGTWNATPATGLTDGTYSVSATVQDPAGNTSIALQSLTIVPDVVAPTGLISVGPMRVFDTRPGFSPSALRSVPKHPVGGVDELEIQITDLNGFVPATGVSAVSLNITATNPANDGFITVYACGTRELVSSVNFLAGQTVANAVITPVSVTGTICIFSSATTDIVADINGWFPTGGAFTSVGPKRVFDTRPDASPALRAVTKAEIQAGGSISVQLTALAELVPADGVSSVSLNVTVTNPAASGFITVYSCGNRELVSSVNYTAGQTVANAVIAPVSATGAVCFYSSAKTHLVVDINGWLKSNSGFTAISPQRVLDTRPGQGTITWREVSKRQVGGDYILQVKLTDLPGLVPANGVGAVSLNVTATDANADGFVTVYPCGPREDVSSVNYVAGRSIANAVLTPVSSTGTLCIYALTPVDIIIDINGWFSTD